MAPPVQPVPDDLVEQILLRLPPGDPGCLFRASLVCKPWRTLLTNTSFGRCYRKFHRTPPLLGFFQEDATLDCWFNPLSPTSPLLPVHPGRCKLRPLDSRHGLVLLENLDDLNEYEQQPASFVVWDPIGHRQWELPHPKISDEYIEYNVAVVCAANGCDHLNCHGGPFLVAYVIDFEGVAYARVYSSEARVWSPMTTCEHPDTYVVINISKPKVLIGNTFYFTCETSNIIVRYDLVSQDLSMIDLPYMEMSSFYVLMTTEDSVLGLANVEKSRQRLCLWSMEAGPDGTVAWAHHRVVDLQKLLPPRAFSNSLFVIGFAEGVGIIFLSTDVGVFTIELKSGLVKKVLPAGRGFYAFPYMRFYTPDQAKGIMPPSPMAFSTENIKAVQGEHHVSLLPQPSREASEEEKGKWEEDADKEGERGNKGKKAIELAQELFDSGLEEPVTINRLDCALKITVAHYGKLSRDCVNTYYEYGYALLYKPQPKSAPFSEKGNAEKKDLDLAWKMMNIARIILEKRPSSSTRKKLQIFHALAIVSMKREAIDYSLSFCSKALAIWKHIVEPDLLQIIQLNLYICLVLVFVSKIGCLNPHCAKAVLLCKSRVQKMENAKEALLADNACAGEGGSKKFSVDDEMEFLAELKKALKDASEQAMSTQTRNSSGEKHVGNAVPRAASLTSSQSLVEAMLCLADFVQTVSERLAAADIPYIRGFSGNNFYVCRAAGSKRRR